jgi:cell cycle checkpoint protein
VPFITPLILTSIGNWCHLVYDDRVPMDREDLFQKFQAFLTRASTCQSIFSTSDATSRTSHSSLHTPPSTHCPSQDQSTTVRVTIPPSRKHIILLEDLPNILHSKTQDSFHSSLQALVDSPNPSIAPIVIIVSDSGVRGEASDEKLAQGGGWGKDVVDIRSVLSPALLASPYVTQIGCVL